MLFDEIEKAHPDVFNLLLQVLGDGEGVRVDAVDGEFAVTAVPRAIVELPTAA